MFVFDVFCRNKKRVGYSGRQDQLAVYGHTGFRAWPSDDQRSKRSLPVGQIRVTQQTDSGPRIRSWQVEMPFLLPEIQPWYTPRNTLAFLHDAARFMGDLMPQQPITMSIWGVPKIGLPPVLIHFQYFSIGFSLFFNHPATAGTWNPPLDTSKPRHLVTWMPRSCSRIGWIGSTPAAFLGEIKTTHFFWGGRISNQRW